jgi:hypothetical protein
VFVKSPFEVVGDTRVKNSIGVVGEDVDIPHFVHWVNFTLTLDSSLRSE